jgi:hypothetical protein
MASVDIDIWNLALSSVGVDFNVDQPNEASRPAELCRLHYPNVRDKALMAANWASAKATRRLALISSTDTTRDWRDGDPEPNWNYAYQLPADYLYPRYTASGGRFTLGVISDKRVLFSGEANIILTYTFRQTNVGLWPQPLVDAVALGLGATIGLPLSGKPDRAQLALQMANQSILVARESVANEEMSSYESIPDWLTMRGIGGNMYPTRFVYPVGPLLSSALLNVQ